MFRVEFEMGTRQREYQSRQMRKNHIPPAEYCYPAGISPRPVGRITSHRARE